MATAYHSPPGKSLPRYYRLITAFGEHKPDGGSLAGGALDIQYRFVNCGYFFYKGKSQTKSTIYLAAGRVAHIERFCDPVQVLLWNPPATVRNLQHISFCPKADGLSGGRCFRTVFN